MTAHKPEILAPAGDMPSFLAALAAGADAVYVGLKHFSARMQAENFSMNELSRMVELAEKHDRRVYVAFNSLVKPGDVESAGSLLARLARDAGPHAIIFQDPGLIDLARQAGFKGECHLSTLANITHPAGLITARQIGADRVILPRELSIDEIRVMAEKCPPGLELEVFIHGALCFAVSGRCYWSSYLGGKSGLRGRCVQPCRRIYRQGKREGRFFSCLDLSLDVLTRVLAPIDRVKAWKIEGRKKGPHYVYHVVTAYRMLRDEGSDPKIRKAAEEILLMALGRPYTRAHFLPQRESRITSPDSQTGSGKLIGKINADTDGTVFIKPHQELLPRDYLRIGYEDEQWHATLPVTRHVPKSGKLSLKLPRHKTPKSGTPVFLIDRREPELMRLVASWKDRLEACAGAQTKATAFNPRLPASMPPRPRSDIMLRATLPTGAATKQSRQHTTALWMTPKTLHEVSRTVAPRMSWWLPPVIWPDEEDVWQRAIIEAHRNGIRQFVLNAPWQISMFARMEADLVAGPFCNVMNRATLGCLATLGFTSAFVSPELGRDDLLALPKQSPLPLGMVLAGFWPMGIARHEAFGLRHNELFLSPKKEGFWTRKYGQNTWVYPVWPINLSAHRKELKAAGFSFFAVMEENPPKGLPESARPGLFNWETALI
jgi:putative protease